MQIWDTIKNTALITFTPIYINILLLYDILLNKTVVKWMEWVKCLEKLIYLVKQRPINIKK